MQGTLYPDVVESGGGAGASNIKSHHNVGGLPDDLEFELVEPLRTLFKDEVRLVGEQLGLPAEIVWRHPFPGPGLGIRIIGAVTRERLDILREADAIAREELTHAGLDRDIWQFPVVLLADVRSVGVQGDGRTYGHPIVLRPVTSEDAMTADWARVPYDVLETISTRITNEVREVNRVTARHHQQAPRHHRVGVSTHLDATGHRVEPGPWTRPSGVSLMPRCAVAFVDFSSHPPGRGSMSLVTAVKKAVRGRLIARAGGIDFSHLEKVPAALSWPLQRDVMAPTPRLSATRDADPVQRLASLAGAGRVAGDR